MTVSYIIIIVIIWKKGSLKIKDKTPNERNEKSKLRRLLSSKRSTLTGKNSKRIFFLFLFLFFMKNR
jgi:hypothetical protein